MTQRLQVEKHVSFFPCVALFFTALQDRMPSERRKEGRKEGRREDWICVGGLLCHCARSHAAPWLSPLLPLPSRLAPAGWDVSGWGIACIGVLRGRPGTRLMFPLRELHILLDGADARAVHFESSVT